jgi:hypothetical protein
MSEFCAGYPRKTSRSKPYFLVDPRAVRRSSRRILAKVDHLLCSAVLIMEPVGSF